MRPLVRALVLAVFAVSGAAPAAPAFVERTLPNGLTVVVVENHSQPLVTVEIGVKNGSMTEDTAYNGLSHLYEHMFFKGNAVIPNQEAYLARARELGLLWDGTTSTERVNYYFTTTTPHFADAMVFMRDAIVSPKFDEKELEKERVVVTGEIDRNLSNPYFHLFHDAGQRLWWKYPTRKDPLGTRATVLAATTDMMRTIQKRYYVPNNSILVVTGDVKSEDVFASTASLYAGWARAEDPFVKFPLVTHPPLPKTEVVLVEQPVRTLTATFNWLGPSTEGPGVADTYAADLLGYAVAQPSSRFQRDLVDSGACVAASFSWSTHRNVGPITLTVTAAPEKGEACLTVALAELPKMKEPGYLSDDDMAGAIVALRTDFASQREKPSTYAHSLSFWWATAGFEYYRSYEANVAKVTRADVARYLDTWVLGKPYVVAVLASPETAKSVIGRSQLEAIVARAAAAPAAAVVAAAPAVAPVTKDIVTCDANGLEVIVKRTRGAEFVSTSLVVRGGVRNWTKESAGVERLALEVAAQGGTESLDKDAFQRRLERMGSTIASESTNDFGVLSVKSFRESFEPTFDLLADAFLKPALPSEEVARAKERVLTSLKQELETPDGALALLGEKTLYSGHPYEARAAGTLASVGRLTREDLVTHLAKLRETTHLFLVVVGDVEPVSVCAKARVAFGNLPLGSYRETPLPKPAFTRASVATEARALDTNYVRSAFPAPGIADKDYPAARVAMRVLDERVFEEVRTKRNLSYAPRAFLTAGGITSGTLYVTAVDPAKTLPVMQAEVEKLRTTPLKDNELRDTKELLLSSWVNQNETTDAQARLLVTRRAWSSDLPEALALLDRMRSVTAADVQAFAKKYFVNMQTAYVGDPAKAPREPGPKTAD
jgi:zinc protease